MKYKVGTTGAWRHATLSGTSSDHTAPTGSIIKPAVNGTGAFIYRSTYGTGTFSLSNVQLRWKCGVNGVTDSTNVQIKVFAIEMVYVPAGSYSLGSGGTEYNAFYKYPTKTNSYLVSSEGTITVGTANDNLYYPYNGYYNGDQQGPIPSACPKGFRAFYCMKYEITQKQYVDFLNTLTYTQQERRTAVAAPNSSAGTKAMFDAAYYNAYRNGIEIQIPGIAIDTPAVYACDLNDNGTYNDTTDGQNIACNWLSWADGAAYSDWAALRPMTELEYEKACRGTLPAVANAYAWGSTSITESTGIINSGAANETASNSGANCNYDHVVMGPMRVGCFGIGSSSRLATGATYYGIREMSGNLLERCVTIGNPKGRSFTGLNGNGVLDSTGNANVANWPNTTAIGAGFRGGVWYDGALSARVSDRYVAAYTDSIRASTYGFRAARLAP